MYSKTGDWPDPQSSLCLVLTTSSVDVLSFQMNGGQLKCTERFGASKPGLLLKELEGRRLIYFGLKKVT